MAGNSWEFDKVHSSISFHVRHLMVSKVHGRFHDWTGVLELDDADLSRSRVEVTIDAASIDTRETKRDDHLRSADFLDVEKFPKLEFRATKIERLGADAATVHGDLTIHGVTRPVTLDVELSGVVKDPWGGTRTGFTAKTTISRKDFGLTWNVALETGGLLVGDKIEIGIEIEAVKATAKAA
jgi:polyisoprenoid-binding protein YceI